MNDAQSHHHKPLALKLLEVQHGDFREVDTAMILAGKSDREIAERFGVSVSSVKNYRRILKYRTARTVVER